MSPNFLTVYLAKIYLTIWLVQITPAGMIRIAGGTYFPMYGQTKIGASVQVHDFLLDAFPVTNQQFLEFVKANPAWRKSAIKRVFADANYLSKWSGDLTPGEGAPLQAPVTSVSWFAARAFARWMGKRLPTTDEWEFVGRASATRKDAASDSSFTAYLLGWYEKPAPLLLPPVGSTFKNVYGVYDMHGLVWEWTEDFNSIMLSGESEMARLLTKIFFVPEVPWAVKELTNYAGFMRYAFRTSLKASYCLQNLGFRCAKDLPDNP